MQLKTIFQHDFRRFKFPGFGSQGTCFLRARVRSDGTSIFLCAQLKNYTGTSITNAVEEIFVEACRLLFEAGAVKTERVHWYSLRRELNLTKIAARSRWIEYYPKGTGMFPEGSYAFVSFDNDFRPVWNYVSLERVIQECGAEDDFFKIKSEDLDYES